MFSRRTEWEFSPNPLSAAVDSRRLRGEKIRDWTCSNPTLVGLSSPQGKILDALSSPASLRYDPDPRGMRSTREAIARFLSRSGPSIDPDSILLTSSSSESYSHLFRLFCEPGDEILIPTPGYPLFDDLARLSDVRVVPYRLQYDGMWHLDRESVRRGLTQRTRAIVAIHPGNPTGAYVATDDQKFLASIAIEHRVPLISDEVFWSFPFEGIEPAPSFGAVNVPLVAVLGGLSKLAALPQMKLGWITVGGERTTAQKALARLEMMGDTYLSVNTPVQVALPAILECADAMAQELRSRISKNLRTIRDGCAGTSMSLLSAQGGWNAILRLPGGKEDDVWAMDILQTHGVLTFPGHYFDLEGGSFLVVSLIVAERETAEYLEILRAHVAAHS